MILDNQKASKNSFQSTTFKDEENSRTFQGLAQKFKDLSRKNGIQGIFKVFPYNSRTFQDCANPVIEAVRIPRFTCLWTWSLIQFTSSKTTTTTWPAVSKIELKTNDKA